MTIMLQYPLMQKLKNPPDINLLSHELRICVISSMDAGHNVGDKNENK